MSKILSVAKELKEAILEEEVVQEYLKVKKIFESDKTLEEFRKHIAYLSTRENKEEYNTALKEYECHPLVSNYYALKSEVVALLRNIKDVIDL